MPLISNFPERPFRWTDFLKPGDRKLTAQDLLDGLRLDPRHQGRGSTGSHASEVEDLASPLAAFPVIGYPIKKGDAGCVLYFSTAFKAA